MERISKELYYLGIAEAVCQRSTCLRRKYGAIIVKNDQIIATGYNGAPRGETNCIDCGHCQREELNIPKGERYELCRAVHAEQNAIISASRSEMIGSTIYIVGKEADGRYANPSPCLICRRMIVNAGISRCVGMVDGKVVEIDLSKESPTVNPPESKGETIRLMHLKIYTFKENGKFYAETEVVCPNNIPLYEDSFKDFVRDNCPSTIVDGFVLLVDLPDGEGFHTHLFRYNELQSNTKEL